MNWKLAYGIGFHPWEDTDREFLQSLVSLLEREEQGREPPYGRALDIGTGSAIWGIELAKRGWDVTGVDVVVSREEVEAASAGWQITDVKPSFFKLPPPLEWVLRPDEHWYRLRRA